MKPTKLIPIPTSAPHSHRRESSATGVRVPKVFKKSLFGDKFGTHTSSEYYSEALMYRARIMDRVKESKQVTEEKQEDFSQTGSVNSGLDAGESDSDSDNDFKQLRTMNPKQQLAFTIKNWSDSPANDNDIINEGAVYALIALTHVEETSIRRWCATSFYRLASRENNRRRLLNIGVTTGVVSLAMQVKKW